MKNKMSYKRQSLRYILTAFLASVTLFNTIAYAEEATDHPELSTYPHTNLKLGAIPDVPALDIKTTAIEDGQYTAPYIPAIRTSNDGRVGLYIKRPGGNTRLFTAIRPESVTTPFDLLEPGIPRGLLSEIVAKNMGMGHHTTLCDGSSVFPESANAKINPKQCGENDCYQLSLIGAKSVIDLATNSHGLKLVQSKFEVEITSPKTTEAHIVNITQIGKDIEGGFMLGVGTFLEPMFTGDGRVLVFRMHTQASTTQFHWQTDDGTDKSGSYDMVYGVIPEGDDAQACDITKFEGPYPISHAPFHAKVNNKYGFAQQPFRDPEGNFLEDGEPLKGTYPWIDREGRNVFFTAIRSRLYYNTGPAWRARYNARCIDECPNDVVLEDGLHSQGVMAMGAWTNGKMVLLDGAFANGDAGLSSTTDAHREISLYSDEQGNEVWERIGSTRDTRDKELPAFGAKNTSFIDSIENMFNFNPHLFPSTPGDVVWRFSTGRATADIAFDDFLNKHSIIVANMNASITHDVHEDNDEPVPVSYTRNGFNMRHNDGFQDFYNLGGRGFTKAPRIQNAATASNAFIPDYGHSHGNIRIEPIAKGGIVGKGLWLDGESGVTFTVGKTLDQAFVSVFVDPRQAGSTQNRRLLSFADGSTLDLSHSMLRYQVAGSSAQGMSFEADLSAFAFTDKTWRHLALQFHPQDEQTIKVDVFLDGFLLSQWTTPQHQPFVAGAIVLGSLNAADTTGFRGWLDEFKVFAHRPDLESVCNHGHGTLVGIKAGTENTKWSQVASKYSSTSHEQVSASIDQTQYGTYPQYACLHNYAEAQGFAKEKAANPILFAAVTGTTLRQPIIFPEGSLHWGHPRPDSSSNVFCLNCHDSSTNFAPLSVMALTLDSETTTQDDLRRQPMQALRLITGKASTLLAACEYNGSVLGVGDQATLVDQCVLPQRLPSVVPDTLYRIIHIGTGYPVRVETWDTVENHAQQGYPVSLETGGLDACDSAECDFRVEALENGLMSINPSNGVITRPLGALGLLTAINNEQPSLANIILRRSARFIRNCPEGDCKFTIVPLGQNKFRIEATAGYSIAKLKGDYRLKTLLTEDCHSQVCEFEFIAIN